MTRRIQEIIDSSKGFECPYVPESNIIYFRHEGDDALQVAIRERLLEEGRFYITSTEILGRRHLRLTVICPQTIEQTVADLLDAIEQIAGDS